METKARTLVSFLAVIVPCFWMFAQPSTLLGAGVPEAGITLYGQVVNSRGTTLTQGAIVWTYTPQAAGKTVTVSAPLQNLQANGDVFSYIVHIPAETALNGASLSANVLATTADKKTYSRRVEIDGRIAKSATGGDVADDTFSTSERGKVQRIDLLVSAAGPEAPTNPDPADGAQNLIVSMLDWNDCEGADFYDLYLWPADQAKPAQPVSSNHPVSQYQPALALAENTTYDWQVVARNSDAATTGPLWTFTTRYTGSVAIDVTPESASWSWLDPDSRLTSGAGDAILTGVPTGAITLTWQPLEGYDAPTTGPVTLQLERDSTLLFAGRYARHTGSVAISVTPASASWILTNGDGVTTAGTGNQTITNVSTGLIALAWQPLDGYLDPAENPATRTLAQGQSLAIEGEYTPIQPGEPAEPDPSDGETNVPTTVTLAWASAERATSYDVFFWKDGATTPTEPTASDLAAPGFQPPTSLQFGWIYNWQVLAKNATGSLFGPIWSFLTVDVADARDLVTHFYVVVLGRDPEAGAVDAWKTGYFDAAVRDRIDVRFVFREMGRLFFLSQEYDGRERSNAEFITDCYEAFLLRTPSAGELQPWLDDVTTPSGEVRWNRAEVMTQFAESQEFENLIQSVFPGEEYRGDPARNFTTTMFIGVFDRISDTGGLEYFSGRMEAAEDKLAEAKKIALEFFLSEEGAAKAPTNEQKVIRLYRAFLGRFPATGEIVFWTGELDSARETLESLIEKFGDSEEFGSTLSAYFKTGTGHLRISSASGATP